jgi:hypothetical protein
MPKRRFAVTKKIALIVGAIFVIQGVVPNFIYPIFLPKNFQKLVEVAESFLQFTQMQVTCN